MDNKDEMIGMRFGRLTVMSRGDNYISPSGYSYITYNCKCDCGKEKNIRKKNLLKGNTNSCGCLHNETILGSTGFIKFVTVSIISCVSLSTYIGQRQVLPLFSIFFNIINNSS